MNWLRALGTGNSQKFRRNHTSTAVKNIFDIRSNKAKTQAASRQFWLDASSMTKHSDIFTAICRRALAS